MLPIYVISLRDAKERQKSIQAQAEILGLEFEFFEAVDGRNGFTKAQEQGFDREKAWEKHKRILSDREIACAMSHALLYKKIAKSNHVEGAIIFEDDVALSFDFAELLASKALERSKEDFIIFYHKRCFTFPWTVSNFFKRYNLCKPVLSASNAVGYFVSQKGAAAIYKNSWPICCVADWGFDIRKIGARMVTPRIVSHQDPENLPSTIGKRVGRPLLNRWQRLTNLPLVCYKFRRIFAVKIS